MQCTCNLLKNILYILLMDMDLNFLIDLKSSVEQLILISKQIQESREQIYSKRNHQTNNIVINYDNGYIDVFLNGNLVGSSVGIVPYMHEDEIIVGANQGLYGGICNVLYYEAPLSKKQIFMNYRTLRIQKIPYIYSLSDDISLKFERKENNKNLLLNDLKSMVEV